MQQGGVLPYFLSLSSYFGLAGTLLIALVALAAIPVYRGRGGERYSLLNHFVSELGELGVSALARWFNAGLTVGGILLLPFLVGLGIKLSSLWGWLGMLAGLWAAVSASLVGVFPMNNLTPHTRAALSYFRSGLVMVTLFGIAIFIQPSQGSMAVPPLANLLSLFAAVCYASFLLLFGQRRANRDEDHSFDPLNLPERPRLWLLPALEWLVFIATILWLFGVAAVS
jgi:hypothetical membrane protein